nr:integrase, catalytic region, zinc finger, CCHC-type, peptidase aspartic, catalytic [Tanacetum cinerariifolium]
MKSLKEKVEDRLLKRDQSLQTVHMLCRPKTYYNELDKVAIGYKNPLCLTCAKKVQPALYNGHEIIKDNRVPAIVHNTEDTLEIAKITKKKMNDKMKNPECVTRKVKIAPHDYSKENFLATFTAQKQLTPKNNRDEHLDYLRHLKESVETIHDIVEEAKVVRPLDRSIVSACRVKRCTNASGSQPRSNTKKNRISPGCSKHMTGDCSRLMNFVKKFIRTVRFGNDYFGAIMGYGDYVIGPAPTFLTPEQISSGLVPNLVPTTPYVPPTNKELEILFQPMFDEYLEPSHVERPISPTLAVPVPVNSAGTPSSTSIDQDASSPSHSPSSSVLQSLCLHQGVAAESTLMDENPCASVDNDPFINIFAPKPTSEASSSGDASSVESTYVTQTLHYLKKWSKDHPIDNVIGNPSRPVSTRKQLATNALCLHQGIAAESTFMEDNPVAPVDNTPFINVFAMEPNSEASSSGDISSTKSTYVSQTLHHLNK